MGKSKVYFTKNISEASLIKIYDALDKNLKGKVAVKYLQEKWAAIIF